MSDGAAKRLVTTLYGEQARNVAKLVMGKEVILEFNDESVNGHAIVSVYLTE